MPRKTKTRSPRCPVSSYWDPDSDSYRTGLDLMEARSERRMAGKTFSFLRGVGMEYRYPTRSAWRHSLFSEGLRRGRRMQHDPRYRRQQLKLQAKTDREQTLAVQIGRMFNNRCKHLLGTSRRGVVQYGSNTAGYTEWKRGKPCRYHASNAGVRIDGKELVLTPVRGQPIRVPMPPAKIWRAAVTGEAHALGLLACRTDRPGVLACYGLVEGWSRWELVGWSIRGVTVPENVVRGDYTAADALACQNAEVRRIMLERLPGGLEAVLTSGAVKEIHRDDFGILYREEYGLTWQSPEHLAFVKVVNSTPEPDGSFKEYLLRVPGTMQTAREAVAWTFNVRPEDFRPVAQT